MEGIKEFLESSTVHGLTYISMSKSFNKLVWIAIVCAGFLTAGYLINNSFSSWEKSPISTSIETLPISEVDFPKIMVCPPKDSNTALNFDLMKAENATIEQDVRNKFVEDAKKLLQDDIFENTLVKNNAYEEKDKYRNWYEGVSLVELPTEGTGGKLGISVSYNMKTTSSSGLVSTPWFGRAYSEENYRMETDFQHTIYLHANISSMAQNSSVVLEMKLITKKTVGGTEYVYITLPGGLGYEILKYTGNITKNWRLNVTDQFTGFKNRISFHFLRAMDQTSLDIWKDKVMSGFSLTWYLMNENGEKISVKSEPDYISDNILFIRWMNNVYNTLVVQNTSEENLWANIRRARIQMID